MAPPKFIFQSSWPSGIDFATTMVVGKKATMERLLPQVLESLTDLPQELVSPAVVTALVKSLDEKTGGGPATTLLANAHKLIIAGLPSQLSRHNHPMGVHTLTKAVTVLKGETSQARLLVLTDDFAIAPLALAIGKAFPVFSMKTSSGSRSGAAAAAATKERELHVAFVSSNGTMVEDPIQLQAASAAVKGVQLTTRLVDSHPELLTTTAFATQVQQLVQEHYHPHVQYTEIVGMALEEQGYGGLYGVGKAANCPPRLIVLEYDGSGGGDAKAESIALVGKGIVYDTGGLSLKPRDGMCGMKGDMGGAAGLLGGFFASVDMSVKKKVTLILCLAENAIGPDAFRHDDILTMYSGKTVEINNTDAEGRLVLGDGVAHATKNIPNLDLVIDMATLTGAQLVATGKKHAGILCNQADLETRVCEAGMHSGDLCYPLLYAPELLLDEFKSEVADMKNSVKDRSNAQTSCAGHFIEAHLHEDYQGGWIHVDMAGPAVSGERSTGFQIE